MLCTPMLLLAALAFQQTGYTDAEIADLARNAIVGDARIDALSSDEIGRTENLRPDPDIARDVNAALKKKLPWDLVSLSVSSNRGQVVLTGRSKGLEATERAAHIAGLVAGVQGVTNRLVTDGQPTVPAPVEVQAATDTGSAVLGDIGFLTRDHLAGRDLELHVAGGEVDIYGLANTPEAKEYVTAAARRAPGARMVRNHMQVRENKPREDERLTKLIAKKFEWSFPLRPVADSLAVKVRQGVATVTGHAETHAQADEILRLAGVTQGVVAVEDRLTGP